MDESYVEFGTIRSSMRNEGEESRQVPPLRGPCWLRGSKPRSAVRRSEQAMHVPGFLAVWDRRSGGLISVVPAPLFGSRALAEGD